MGHLPSPGSIPVVQRKQKARERKERKEGRVVKGKRGRKRGNGWESWGKERQQVWVTGRADGKWRDGHQREEWDAAEGGRIWSGRVLK